MKLTEKLEKIGKKAGWQWLAVAVAFVIAFPAAGFSGAGREPAIQDGLPVSDQEVNSTKMDGQETETVAENTEDPKDSQKSADAEEMTADETEKEENSAEETDTFQAKYEDLPQETKQLLEEICEAMKAQDMTQTAKLLDKKQDVLAELFYGTFEGQRFFYDGNSVSENIEGVGLVFTMPEVVFYGTFENGYPQGSCLALQFINVDSPRYNYSAGLWNDGKMNGQGTTGYCYYENVPQGEYAWVIKTGNFVDDLLEGDITYEIKGADDTISHWDMHISQGKIQLDDRWTHLDDMGEYQLMSSDSASHAYLIADDQLEQLLWMNLLGWE